KRPVISVVSTTEVCLSINIAMIYHTLFHLLGLADVFDILKRSETPINLASAFSVAIQPEKIWSPWRVQYEHHRSSRVGDACTPSLADLPHIYPDLDDSRGLVGASLDEPDDQRRLARPDPAHLQQCQSLRPHSAQHGRAPRFRPSRTGSK